MITQCDLSRDGLLWLINRVVFHPRGFALAAEFEPNSNRYGFSVLGTGKEPFVFSNEEDDEKFLAAESFLQSIKERNE